jgi:hypothetical protein
MAKKKKYVEPVVEEDPLPIDYEEWELEEDIYDFEEDVEELLDVPPDEPEKEPEPEGDVDFWISECLLVRHYDDKWERERDPYVICGEDKDAYLDKLNRLNNVMKYTGRYNWKKKPQSAKNYKDAMVMAGGLYDEFFGKKVNIDMQRVDEIESRPYCRDSRHQMNFSGVIETPGVWSTASCDRESEWCYQYDASNIERYIPDYFETR